MASKPVAHRPHPPLWRWPERRDRAADPSIAPVTAGRIVPAAPVTISPVTISGALAAQRRIDTEVTLSGQGVVLRAIVEGRPLEDVIGLIAELVAAEIPGSAPAIAVRDADGLALTVLAAPAIPTRLWPAVERQAIRTTLAGLTGTRHRLDQERRVVVTPDVGADPSWDEWRTAAAEHGLVCSWSMAFVGAGNIVLGAFVVYFAAPAHPGPKALRVLGDAAQLAAVAAQHVPRRQRQLPERTRSHSLTDLPNRVILLERLRTAQLRLVASRSCFAVIQLAIDGLARLTDTLGPAASDEVLRLAAQRLVRAAGPSATVAHVWGVEFAILVEDLADAAQAGRIAATLGDACREAFDVEGLTLSVGATVGVVVYSPEPSAEVTLVDGSLPAPARLHGGTGVAIEVHEPDHLTDPAVMAPELRRGIDENELSVVYQPIVRLADKGVARYEALLRWRSPRRGPIPPATFVRVAEQTGLVSDLGRYALREALTELARVRIVNPDVGISVNVSVRQLADEKLPTLLAELLDEHRLARGSVTLEVTEGVLLRSGAAGWRVLAGLRDIGARIALDDFGTGFSQLSYLRQFWFDEIKIDRSFVTAMMRDVAARATIVGVIAVARYAGSEIVAEGVERPEQRAMLLEFGATLGQGYLFGAPGLIAAP